LRIKDLTAVQFARLCALLDGLLDLEGASRAEKLAELLQTDGEFAPLLGELLRHDGENAPSGSYELLETGELILRQHRALGGREPPLVGRRVGPYRVLSLLGRGGMGSVWLAQRDDGLFARQVALKLVHPALADRCVIERFSREREILAGLIHPNIARLYDAGVTADEQPYLALQYVEGVPITLYCDQHGCDIRARLGLFLQVLSAVQYAHASLVIHRDLKPSNILVTSDGHVQLLDFGVAKLLSAGEARETELTRLGGRVLTPAYAAPEQITGAAVTTSCDVYSLGVILFELLTGTRPYRLERDSPAALEEAVVMADPGRPSQAALTSSAAAARGLTARRLARALHGDMDTIVLKALRKSPDERFATVEGLARDIERYLAGRPVLAQPDTLWYRCGKFVRRNRLPVSAGLAVVIALLLGVALALTQAQRASREARVARAVQGFLQDVFEENSKEQPNPAKAQQATARELLSIGAAKVDQSLRDSPQARLEVLETLGRITHDLSLDDQSVELQRKRVALARQLYGPDDLRVAASLRDLALASYSTKDEQERPAIVAQALTILDRNHDSSSVLRANLLGDLAQHYAEYDTPRALGYAAESLRLMRAQPPSQDLNEALVMLAWLHQQLGHYAQSEPLYAEAVRTSMSIDGNPNPHLPRLYYYLAQTQSLAQEYPAAEDNYRESYRVAADLLGGQIDIWQVSSRLGDFLSRTGRTREGLEYLHAAYEGARHSLPPDDALNAPMLMEPYGWALVQFGQIETGLAILDDATLRWRRYHASSSYLISALERSAFALIDVGEYARANALLEESSALRTALHDQDTYPNGNAVARIKLALALGRDNDAGVALAGYRVSAGTAGAPSASAIEHSLLQGQIASARGDYETAGALAAESLRLLRGSAVRSYLRELELRALTLQGQAAIGLKQAPEATASLTDALQLATELYDPQTSLRLASLQVSLAQALADEAHTQHARELLAQATGIYARHPAVGTHLREPLDLLRARLRHAAVTQRN
jgi:serine/threonine-protein kinase